MSDAYHVILQSYDGTYYASRVCPMEETWTIFEDVPDGMYEVCVYLANIETVMPATAVTSVHVDLPLWTPMDGSQTPGLTDIHVLWELEAFTRQISVLVREIQRSRFTQTSLSHDSSTDNPRNH